MQLSVLSVAYPLAPVAPWVAGGAEQVLLKLDHAMQREGHRSLVVACSGSQIAGELIEAAPLPAVLDDRAIAAAQHAYSELIEGVLDREQIDIVHIHGIDFHRYLPKPGPRVLVTLHLPLDWYASEVLSPTRPRTWLHCVSAAQDATRPSGARFLSPIDNGVDVDLPPGRQGGEFALFLGRICWEKGVHIAIESARLAGVPLVVAGTVFPYTDHMRYFSEQIAPNLNGNCRYIAWVDPAKKVELLRDARCLLIPSLVEETSSLVAREALAAGTPVVAFPRAALAEIIDHGRTGFLADTPRSMAEAIDACSTIDPAVCQDVARRRFPLNRMVSKYLSLYQQIAGGRLDDFCRQ